MRRTTVLLAAAAVLVAGAGHAATAAPAPKPQKKTFYLHGSTPFGNLDRNPVDAGTPLAMDTKKPTGTQDKYYGTYGAVASPNSQCAGSPFYPGWSAPLGGKLVGKATVTFWAVSSGGNAKFQLFNDVTESACNEAYPGPIGEATVALPSGPSPQKVTVTFPVSSKLKVVSTLLLQIQSGAGPELEAVVYDSTASPASLSITCLPKTGKKAC